MSAAQKRTIEEQQRTISKLHDYISQLEEKCGLRDAKVTKCDKTKDIFDDAILHRQS